MTKVMHRSLVSSPVEAMGGDGLYIFDKSGNHIDHEINSGGGHFKSIIVSNDFINKSLIERHRMVYNALGDMMKNEIHAFSMKTLTVDEYEKQS